MIYQSGEEIFKEMPRSVRYINEVNISIATLVNDPFGTATTISLKMWITSVTQTLHALVTLKHNGKCQFGQGNR